MLRYGRKVVLLSRFVRRPTVLDPGENAFAVKAITSIGLQHQDGAANLSCGEQQDPTAIPSSLLRVHHYHRLPAGAAVDGAQLTADHVPPAPLGPYEPSLVDDSSAVSAAEISQMSNSQFFMKFVLPAVPAVPTVLSILSHRIPYWRLKWKRLRMCFEEFPDLVQLNVNGTMITACKKCDKKLQQPSETSTITISLTEFVTRVLPHIPREGILVQKLGALVHWEDNNDGQLLIDVLRHYSAIVDVVLPDSGGDIDAAEVRLRTEHSVLMESILGSKKPESTPTKNPSHSTATSQAGSGQQGHDDAPDAFTEAAAWFNQHSALPSYDDCPFALPKDPLKVHVIQTAQEADAACSEIQAFIQASNFVLGVHAEWSNDRLVGAKKVSLLRIATATDVFLFRLRRTPGDVFEPEPTEEMQLPGNLLQLLRDKRIIKMAVGIHQTAAKLKEDYDIEVLGCVDTHQLLLYVGYPVGASCGLRAFTMQLCNFALPRDLVKLRTDWEANTLSNEQIEHSLQCAMASYTCSVDILRRYGVESRELFDEKFSDCLVDSGAASPTPDAETAPTTSRNEFMRGLRSRNILIRVLSVLRYYASEEQLLSQLRSKWRTFRRNSKREDFLRDTLRRLGATERHDVLPCVPLPLDFLGPQESAEAYGAKRDELRAEVDEEPMIDIAGLEAALLHKSSSRPSMMISDSSCGLQNDVLSSSLLSVAPSNSSDVILPPSATQTARSAACLKLPALPAVPVHHPQPTAEAKVESSSGKPQLHLPPEVVLSHLTDAPKSLEEVAVQSKLSVDELRDWCSAHSDLIDCMSFDASITLISRRSGKPRNGKTSVAVSNHHYQDDHHRDIDAASIDVIAGRVSSACCTSYDHQDNTQRVVEIHKSKTGKEKTEEIPLGEHGRLLEGFDDSTACSSISLVLAWRVVNGDGKLTLIDVADNLSVKCEVAVSVDAPSLMPWRTLVASPPPPSVDSDVSVVDEGPSASEEADSISPPAPPTVPPSQLTLDTQPAAMDNEVTSLRHQIAKLQQKLLDEKSLTESLAVELMNVKKSRNDFVRHWVVKENASRLPKKLAKSMQHSTATKRCIRVTAQRLRKYLAASAKTEKHCRRLMASIDGWESIRNECSLESAPEEEVKVEEEDGFNLAQL